MISQTRGSFHLLCALSLGAIAGCAATVPPPELVDARAAYRHAEASQAPRLSPVQLHEAKEALDTAEKEFANESDDPRTRDLAYVALRRAELAETAAHIAESRELRAKAASDLQALQARGLSVTTAALSRTKEQLAADQRAIAVTRNELATTDRALTNERKARSDAEERAREAMSKLTGAAGLAVKEETRGTAITVPATSLFASANAILLPAAREKLDVIAAAIKDQDDRPVVVEGHTDAQGTEASNRELSQKRAQAVADYLVSRGVPAAGVTAVGVGQTRPVGDNKTAEGRTQNRRIEIVLRPSQSPY